AGLMSLKGGAEWRDLVSANTSCWFALRRRTSARPIAPLAPAIRILIALPFSSLCGDSKRGQVMLSCKHATHRGSRPVPKPSHNSINCRAASRSLVVDRGLSGMPGHSPRRDPSPATQPDVLHNILRLHRAAPHAVDDAEEPRAGANEDRSGVIEGSRSFWSVRTRRLGP